MGFHIANIKNNKLYHDYVETFEELSFVEFISNDTIIYQGEENWRPVKVSDSVKYKDFANGWFRAGIQAQELFKEQATNSGYILEMLNQDQKSFKSYTANVNNASIKRGDFLIRNFGNIEIEVKCKSFIEVDGELIFEFNCEHALKHQNMQKYTNTPILIAVYENVKDRPVDDSVYFFSIDKLMMSKDILKHVWRDHGECVQIPVSFTEMGFSLIEKTYGKLVAKPAASNFIERQRQFYENAYARWTYQDDERLESLFCDGYSINDLSKEFGRNNGAIRARINKLELIEKYGS